MPRIMNSRNHYTLPCHIRIPITQAPQIGISPEIYIGLLFVVVRRIWSHIRTDLYTDLEEDIYTYVASQAYYDTLDIVNNLDEIVGALSRIEQTALPIIEHLITDICIDRQGQYIYMRFI